jgi:uncharacterized protein
LSSTHADPVDFIDIARLGRTDAGSNLKAFLAIAAAPLLAGGCYALIKLLLADRMDAEFDEILLLFLLGLAWFGGLFYATRIAHRRPLLSLIAADGRIRPAQIALGMALWFCTYTLLLALILIVVGPQSDADAGLSDTLLPPPWVMLAAALGILLFPLQAAGEEMAFRGWMTQTLGRYLRRRVIIALIVAVTFALAHGLANGIFAMLYYVVLSLGLSALTFAEQRLELAIGMHAGNNILALLAHVMSSAGTPHPSLILAPHAVAWWAPLLALGQILLIQMMARWIRYAEADHFAGTSVPTNTIGPVA